jgi:hypothetical protein
MRQKHVPWYYQNESRLHFQYHRYVSSFPFYTTTITPPIGAAGVSSLWEVEATRKTTLCTFADAILWCLRTPQIGELVNPLPERLLSLTFSA